jgi:hypothetical protein
MDEKFRSAKKVDALTGVALEHFMDSHQTLESDCIALELTSSLATVRKIRAVLTGSDPTYSSLHSLHIELEGRLIDEAEAKVFLALNIREADIYNNPRKGWEEIVERFPDTVTDIEEASKCFALSRYAAAIFHSVQVVEVGLIDLGKLIGTTDPCPVGPQPRIAYRVSSRKGMIPARRLSGGILPFLSKYTERSRD